MSHIIASLRHAASRAYRAFVPYGLRRELWYRRNTGQSYAASLPSKISLPSDAETEPIHEAFAVDVDISLAKPHDGVTTDARDLKIPRVKIIILSYNNPLYLRLTLKSILEKTTYACYEVLIVDNGSAPASITMLTEMAATHPRINVLCNKHNLGFSGGINVGLREATDADIIVLLNDDVIVTAGWLTRLVGHLSDFTIGMVGPVTSFTSNAARIPIDYTRIEDIERFAQTYTSKHRQETFDVAMFPMFCVALRRETINTIGLLDERFKYGMFEDDDYALRLQMQGYRIVCARDVFVHHFGGASFSKIEAVRFKAIFEANRSAFEEKWQRTWTPPSIYAGASLSDAVTDA